MFAIAHRLPRQALEARVNALTMATNLKRAAVVAEARNQGAGGEFTGDAAVLNVKLWATPVPRTFPRRRWYRESIEQAALRGAGCDCLITARQPTAAAATR